MTDRNARPRPSRRRALPTWSRHGESRTRSPARRRASCCTKRLERPATRSGSRRCWHNEGPGAVISLSQEPTAPIVGARDLGHLQADNDTGSRRWGDPAEPDGSPKDVSGPPGKRPLRDYFLLNTTSHIGHSRKLGAFASQPRRYQLDSRYRIPSSSPESHLRRCNTEQ